MKKKKENKALGLTDSPLKADLSQATYQPP